MPENHPDGYLATPATGTGPGILLLHPWWGLNDTIKGFCDQLAEAGFVVFAPDLYHGKVTTSIPEAEDLSQALADTDPQAMAEILEAIQLLGERSEQAERGFAVIAFSMGAYYALDVSNAHPEHIHSVVLFYGTGAEDLSSSRAAYLGHFAETDPYEGPEEIAFLEKVLQDAGRPATFYTYPGTGHWFCEPDRQDAYNPEAASLAWERTLTFLKRPLAQ